MGVSLRPSDAQQGGFLDDADVTILGSRFTVWDYQGKGEPTVALKVSMQADGDEQVHEQYYSAGRPDKFQPTEDGKTIEPLGGATGLNVSTNALAFLTSLVNAGFPEDRLGEDASVLEGAVVHVNQVAQPKRPGLKDQKDGKTYLMVTKIIRLPWEAAPHKAAPAAKGAPATKKAAPVAVAIAAPATPAAAAAPAAESNGNMVEKARATVVGILAEKGGTIPKGKLPTEAFRALASDPDRNAVVSLVYKEDFLVESAASGAFGYDGTNVVLA
jgi:hypothetical protein